MTLLSTFANNFQVKSINTLHLFVSVMWKKGKYMLGEKANFHHSLLEWTALKLKRKFLTSKKQHTQ